MKINSILLWAARGIGLLVCSFFLLFFFAEGLPELLENPESEFFKFMPLMSLAIAGYIISWIRPLFGATLMIVGGLLMLVYHVLSNEYKMAIIYGMPFLIVGFLFLLDSKRKTYTPK